MNGQPSLSVGDLLGSNVFNIGVVVGTLMLTAGFLKECPEGFDELAEILLISSIVPLILVVFRVPALLLGIGLLSVFVLVVYKETRTRTLRPLPNFGRGKKQGRIFPILIKVLVGTAVVVLSARFVVSSALEIVLNLNVDTIVVGASLVAFGTSLPELSLGLAAVKRGRMRLASANAIGSNLTNLTLILAVVLISSTLRPFTLDAAIFSEIISFVLITSLIIWYHMTKGADCRVVGITLVLTYILFQVNLLFR